MYTRSSLLAVVLLIPLSLHAQDSTTATGVTPFRRGQWAAQFQAGAGFTSLGFLKFHSPTRALVLDLRLTGHHAESMLTDTAGTHFLGLSSGASTQLRFGWRRFPGMAKGVVSHYTLGLIAGFDHSAASSSGFSTQRNGWTAGGFGDIGATYLVTHNLGLGALAAVSLTYMTSQGTGQPSQGKTRTWEIDGSAVNASLVATLFF